MPCDDVIRIYRTITHIRLLPSLHTRLYTPTTVSPTTCNIIKQNRRIQLVNERGEDEVAPVTFQFKARQVRAADNATTSSSSGVQGGSATATTTNQNNDLGAPDVNEHQGEYGGEGENKERAYYDEERVLARHHLPRFGAKSGQILAFESHQI